MDSVWHSPGPCPFLTCLIPGPHTHAVCPDCGAVRYGNPLFCRTCNTVLNAEWTAHGLAPLPMAGGE